jgi:hypothetical protein
MLLNKERQMQNEISDLYYRTFSTDAGKRVLEDLERHCQFTPNTTDSNDVFLRLGKIELLKYIKRMIERNK